ncbi:hypothetical protein D9615_006703 [Tricholomella constricta]|uniref:YTH domain-containing protein n=1 Tax=Tricholomella constricta TaxID=117010 RepID=A0A8H5M1M1_9AGAR|nr:hypothetical protein D9615_006703 [Tricholomella constricta]
MSLSPRERLLFHRPGLNTQLHRNNLGLLGIFTQRATSGLDAFKMVESLTNDNLILRRATPTQSFLHLIDLDAEKGKTLFVTRMYTPRDQARPFSHKFPTHPAIQNSQLPVAQSVPDTVTQVFYDTSFSVIPPAHEADPSGGLDSARGSREGKPDSSRSMPDHSRSNRRRSPRSPSTPHHRSSITRPTQSSASSYGPPAEEIHNHGSSAAFQPSPLHYINPPLPYDQRSGYRQYVMSSQPSLNMDHPLPPFPYSHPYDHHFGLPDNNRVSQNIHANYQSMLQPPSAFHYQRHSPDGASNAHHAFTSAKAPSIYGQHQVNTSPPIHSPPPPNPTVQSGSHAPYAATGIFHPLNYSSTAPYGHPPVQAYTASPPIYSQYAHAPYVPHFAPSSDTERGTWWYMPHAAATVTPQQQYDNGTASYQSHYPIPYMRHEVEPFSSHAASSPTSSSAYPMSPIRPTSPVPHSTSRTGHPETNNRSPPVEKPLVRRSYHPNPPAHRSEWVMWAGNVPSDATHDELWRFFNQPPESASDSPLSTGVLSIFLISRSSCAFVNFEGEYYLNKAIERFNGQALRRSDARCPRLVCRVRKKDDDLKAGVGGQRGIGIHTRWIKEQKEKAMESSNASDVSTSDDRPSTASSDQLPVAISSLSLSSDDVRRQRPAKHSSSSGSFTSTNSSLLTRFFPQRYFILKSLTQSDLDLSVEKGLWATQKHNEGILDQAFRTSQDVYLIFSVNKSGEFYGYAKMAGPIRRGEHRVSWATRTTDSSPSSRSSLSPATGRGSVHSPNKSEEPESPSRVSHLQGGNQANLFFSPGTNRFVEESPLPVSAGIDTRKQDAGPTGFLPDGPLRQTAPAELGAPRHKITMVTPLAKHSLDLQFIRSPVGAAATPPEDFELDPTAPIRAMRSGSSGDNQEQGSSGRPKSTLQAVAEEEEKGEEGLPDAEKRDAGGDGNEAGAANGDGMRDDWGESFKIEWLSTEKLPFHRTRHIRNPWNHDREVKVSRDGTEVEPTVGKRLLEEWTRLSEAQSPTVPAGKVNVSSKRGPKSLPVSTVAPPSEDTEIGVAPTS